MGCRFVGETGGHQSRTVIPRGPLLFRHRIASCCAAVVSTAALLGCSQQASPSPGPESSAGSADLPAGVPSRSAWLADVHRAMSGWRPYLEQRARQAGGDPARSRLAVNLDIDNSSIATVYDFPAAVPDVLSFARYAHRRGFAVLFNTARSEGSVPARKATEELTAAGYPVDGICFRRDGEGTVEGKQRCRRHFRDEG